MYEVPGMTWGELVIFDKLTTEQQRDFHYGGWSAVWHLLSDADKQAIMDDFELYGDR